jgi:hypothetical protein
VVPPGAACAIATDGAMAASATANTDSLFMSPSDPAAPARRLPSCRRIPILRLCASSL